MRPLHLLLSAGLCVPLALPAPAQAQDMPFQHKIEVYREKDSDVIAFVLRLEQPFLAEEFEKSNYLRLHALDRNAYLIYPKETKFQQKHAEFFGRLDDIRPIDIGGESFVLHFFENRMHRHFAHGFAGPNVGNSGDEPG